MKRRYKHWYTYWLTAAVLFLCACGQIYAGVYKSNINFGPLCYLLAAGWLALAAREIYWYYCDKKAEGNKY